MPFSIDEFNAELNRSAVAPQSHFVTTIVAPPKITDAQWGPSINSKALAEGVSFRCEQAEIPGRQVATTDTRIYGPIRKIAYTQTFTEVNMTFICSHDLREKVFFDKWQEVIVGMGNEEEDRYDVAYYNDYISQLQVQQYDVSNNVTYTVEYIDAFPVTVAPLTLSWGSSEIHKVQVTFAYHHWKRKRGENFTQLKPRGARPGDFISMDSGLDFLGHERPGAADIIGSLAGTLGPTLGISPGALGTASLVASSLPALANVPDGITKSLSSAAGFFNR
tara:strand:+ start:199 stop:1029 length:831 start_codon:yes stop_codon:yes gene_type:complete